MPDTLEPARGACRAGDIVTPRLALRLMEGDDVMACLAGDLAFAGRRLGMAIPDELLDEPDGLQHSARALDEDPAYLPWSIRAIVLSAECRMVGLIRFHSCPDPAYLRPYARDAVELGWRVFPGDRGRGYATEAAIAAMGWASMRHGVRRFVASIAPDNTVSMRLARRLGFRKIGEAPDEVADEAGEIEDVLLRQV